MELQEIEGIVPDENGIIELVVEGKPRRFVKDKLVSYLSRGQKPKGKGSGKRKAVIVTTPAGKELPFKSSAEASRKLNVCRTNIPHALSGKYSHVSGYRFRYANETTNNQN